MRYTFPVYLLILFFFYSCTSASQKEDPSKEWRENAEQIIQSIPKVEIPDRRIDLTDFAGHEPDIEGTYDFKTDIQKAINQLAEDGGGTLYFPHTKPKSEWKKQILTYRIKGPIHLESNIELTFDPSVRLYFEFDPNSYMLSDEGTLRRFEGTTLFSFSPLIYAFNKKNIALTFDGGSGADPIIDGDGMRWLQWRAEKEARKATMDTLTSKVSIRDINNQDIPLRERHFTDMELDIFRPELMLFFMCENILIDGVKLENAPFWMVHTVFSKNMTFRNLLFDGQVANNDAFDIESSRNALIENIQFSNHDDNLAVKAGRDKEGRDGVDVRGTLLEGIENEYIRDGRLGGATEDMVLRNSVFKGHHAISIGSEMSGGVKNIYAYDNFSPIEVENGLYLKSSRKRGGEISQIYFFNNHFQKVQSLVSLIPNYDGDTTSTFIPRFSEVHVYNSSAKIGNTGIRLVGWKEKPIENVYISDVEIDSVTNPEQGVNIINVQNVQLNNVFINGKTWNETISRIDSSSTPPWLK